jgi:hypothetical protein
VYRDGAQWNVSSQRVLQLTDTLAAVIIAHTQSVIQDSTRSDGPQRLMCFVEFDNAYQATIAKMATSDYQLDRNDNHAGVLSVHYARGRRSAGSGGNSGGDNSRGSDRYNDDRHYDDRRR